jgi:hypothetical protein
MLAGGRKHLMKPGKVHTRLRLQRRLAGYEVQDERGAESLASSVCPGRSWKRH